MRRYVLLACIAAAVVAGVLVVTRDDTPNPGTRSIKWDVAVVDPGASEIRIIYRAVTPANAPERISPRYARVERTPAEVRGALIGPDLKPARVQSAENRAACVLVPTSIAPGMTLRDGTDLSLAVEPSAKVRAEVMRTRCPPLRVRVR